jgi:hypothetical protein
MRHTVIGSVKVAGVTAVLSSRGLWRSPDRNLTSHLNLNYDPSGDGPSAGAFGRAQVARAADRLGGEAWFAPPPPAEPDEFGPGVVY